MTNKLDISLQVKNNLLPLIFITWADWAVWAYQNKGVRLFLFNEFCYEACFTIYNYQLFQIGHLDQFS